MSGAELVGLTYSGPFDDIPFQIENQNSKPRRVVAADWVGETEGTGIVHIAPGCGAEDFELGKAQDLGFIAPVTTSAHFRSECGDELVGLHALNDVETVFEALTKRDRLYRIQKYKHSYPHCWRCSSELIFYATKEWFIRADAGPTPARGRLQSAAAKVEWIPEYAGKRMQDWLVNMGDWNISRKRFWGLPLPFFRDEESGEWDVIGSRAELRERALNHTKSMSCQNCIVRGSTKSKSGTKPKPANSRACRKWATRGSTPESCRFQPLVTTAPTIFGCRNFVWKASTNGVRSISFRKCASRCVCGFSRCCGWAWL
jgi:isoleucyl-tRNA synthetase